MTPSRRRKERWARRSVGSACRDRRAGAAPCRSRQPTPPTASTSRWPGFHPLNEIASGRDAVLVGLRGARGHRGRVGCGLVALFLAVVLGPYKRGDVASWWGILISAAGARGDRRGACHLPRRGEAAGNGRPADPAGARPGGPAARRETPVGAALSQGRRFAPVRLAAVSRVAGLARSPPPSRHRCVPGRSCAGPATASSGAPRRASARSRSRAPACSRSTCAQGRSARAHAPAGGRLERVPCACRASTIPCRS